MVMLVDDEPAQQRLVTALAARAGWRTLIAPDAETARAMLGTRDGMMLDAVMVDQAVPGADAAGLIRALRAERPLLPILLLTALGATQVANDAMRAGASDFLVKPVAPERMIAALDATTVSGGLKGELRPLTEKLVLPMTFGEIVGSDPEYRAALAIAAKAARSKLPVMIEGEPGSGKAVVARAIHLASAREKKPFLIVDCAAIPANLLESELFGHEKGAFTGAFTRAQGKLIDADGGTIFLDDVAALPAEAQLRLLRFIETGEVHPIGARGFREVDVRVITADDGRLRAIASAGGYREDLFFKLSSIHLAIPPLRVRSADVTALARHLLNRISIQPGMRPLGITDDALALLTAYGWPGNVRQLHDALFRAALLCDGDALTAVDFPHIASLHAPTGYPGRATAAGVALYRPDGHIRLLEEIEADVIRLAIGHYRGRMTEVARRLGIGRSTLYRKLAELGISDAA